MAKDCLKCGYPNLNNAFQCDKCGHFFDDVIKCTYCGTFNYKGLDRCIKCKREINISENKYENRKNGQEYNKKSILFDCVVCHNEFTINVIDIFNAFACKNCRSIFSYEWKDNKLLINVVKKAEIIPDSIKKLINFFNLEPPIELDKLRKKYHKLLSQYHPDKVSHLADEFKELSEKKTKEIIENYEELQNWVKIK